MKKQIKITLQMCGIPGGPMGGVKYRIEKLTNAVVLTIETGGRSRKVDVDAFLTEDEVQVLCDRAGIDVTVLAPKRD